MKLIVGFGNPGNQYNFTRHNTGFLALDFYTKVKGLTFEKNPKFNAVWLKDSNKIFIKPQTFYNEVGTAIQAFKSFYKIENKDILVICDDFNLEFGKLRERQKGSAGGNNGLKSTIEKLGTDEFPRLRVGTANDSLRKKIGDTDFVLSKFTEAEKKKLPEVLNEIVEKIDLF